MVLALITLFTFFVSEEFLSQATLTKLKKLQRGGIGPYAQFLGQLQQS